MSEEHCMSPCSFYKCIVFSEFFSISGKFSIVFHSYKNCQGLRVPFLRPPVNHWVNHVSGFQVPALILGKLKMEMSEWTQGYSRSSNHLNWTDWSSCTVQPQALAHVRGVVGGRQASQERRPYFRPSTDCSPPHEEGSVTPVSVITSLRQTEVEENVEEGFFPVFQEWEVLDYVDPGGKVRRL